MTDLVINGTNARVAYGVLLTDKALTNLLAPPTYKDFIRSSSPLEDGERVLVPRSGRRIASRDVDLELFIKAKSKAEFEQKKAAFLSVISDGVLNLNVSDDTNTIYQCILRSCSAFSIYNGRLGKFSIKLYEPNPANRN